MASMITVFLTPEELKTVTDNLGAQTKSLLRHEIGDGHSVKSIKSLPSVSGVYEVEIILDYDGKELLKSLSILD